MTTQQDNTAWRPSSKEGTAEKGQGLVQGEKPASGGTPAARNVSEDKDSPASRYIRENFRPEDRVALVAINKKSGAVIQRLTRAESAAAPDSQRWLRYLNENNYEIHIGMNVLKEDARGRTKDEIAAIRHIYLDLDRGGQEALDKLIAHTDLPRPNYVLSTSPGRYQVVWQVEGFTREQAEQLQRGLAREAGGDPAATDSSRVLRLPGFYNRKYEPAYLVESEKLSEQVHKPEHFPQYAEIDRSPASDSAGGASTSPRIHRQPERITQSERDWAYARRALSRGESKESVMMAIASYRRFTKPHAGDYARRTVEKASRSLETRTPGSKRQSPARER